MMITSINTSNTLNDNTIKAYSMNFGPKRKMQRRSEVAKDADLRNCLPRRSVHFPPEAVALTTLANVGVPIARYYGHRRLATGLGVVGIFGAGYFIARPPTGWGGGYPTPVARVAHTWQTPSGQTGQSTSTVSSHFDILLSQFMDTFYSCLTKIAQYADCIYLACLN